MKNRENQIMRPKVKMLEGVFNDIVNTIGSQPAESGGLLFGSEVDMIVRKFVFDKHAKTTRSTYSFNTQYLNPEIKRLWAEEGLSCIGFIHSHPKGFDRLSQPDLEYFSSMFDSMPREYYITPVVFTVPDGGFKMNAFIIPNQSKNPLKADIEILPDDFKDLLEIGTTPTHLKKSFNYSVIKRELSKRFDLAYSLKVIWSLWRITFTFGLTYFIFKTLYIITNYFKIIFV